MMRQATRLFEVATWFAVSVLAAGTLLVGGLNFWPLVFDGGAGGHWLITLIVLTRSGRTVRWVIGRRHQRRPPYPANGIPMLGSGLVT